MFYNLYDFNINLHKTIQSKCRLNPPQGILTFLSVLQANDFYHYFHSTSSLLPKERHMKVRLSFFWKVKMMVLCASVWWYSTGKLELFRHMDVASVWPRKGEAFKPNTTQLPQLNIGLRASCVGAREPCLGAWCHENIKLCWNFEGGYADNCS